MTTRACAYGHVTNDQSKSFSKFEFANCSTTRVFSLSSLSSVKFYRLKDAMSLKTTPETKKTVPMTGEAAAGQGPTPKNEFKKPLLKQR